MTSIAEWTPDRIQLLRELWDTGAPASLIADEMKITRNAVLGKAHRLGLSERVQRVSQEEAKRRLAERRKRDNARRDYRRQISEHSYLVTPTSPKNKPKVVEMFIHSLNIPYADLRNYSASDANQCRYIEGDAHPFAACGNETEDGHSYCAHHDLICHYTEKRISDADHDQRVARGFNMLRKILPSSFALTGDTERSIDSTSN